MVAARRGRSAAALGCRSPPGSAWAASMVSSFRFPPGATDFPSLAPRHRVLAPLGWLALRAVHTGDHAALSLDRRGDRGEVLAGVLGHAACLIASPRDHLVNSLHHALGLMVPSTFSHPAG